MNDSRRLQQQCEVECRVSSRDFHQSVSVGAARSVRTPLGVRGLLGLLFCAVLAGPALASATLSPNPIVFGPQGIFTISPPQIVTFTNTGTRDVMLVALSISGDAADLVADGPFGGLDSCGGNFVSPGQSCSFDLSIRPRALGERNIVLTPRVRYSGDTADTVLTPVDVRGTGIQTLTVTCLGPYTVNNTPGQCQGFVFVEGIEVTGHVGGYHAEVTPPTIPSIFPVGTTTFLFTVRDDAGQTASCTTTVTVLDTEPPKLTYGDTTCPPDLVFFTDPGKCYNATIIPASPTASDNCPGVTLAAPRSDGQPLNAQYPVGTTTITWTATDAAGNTARGTQDVRVYDAEPPAISNASASPSVLWPPNHKMVEITVGYETADNCDPPSLITGTLAVTTSEPVNGTGDGDTAPDWEIVDAHHVRLRAERAQNGPGRTYTFTITCTDSSGNAAIRTVTVNVPKSRG